MNKCIGYSLGQSVNSSALLKQLEVEFSKIRECIIIEDDSGEYILFPYGVLVFWGDKPSEKIMDFIKVYIESPYRESETNEDEFTVSTIDGAVSIAEDTIFITDNRKERLSVSHAIAQSLKLSQIEDEIHTSIDNFSIYPKQLADTGKIKESKKTISRQRGSLFC